MAAESGPGQAYRRLIRNGPLMRLMVGEFVSSIGDWLYLVALLVVVYAESTSEILLGVVAAARIVPYILLSVPAGIVADRFDRRLVLLVTDVARGVLMVGLAVLVATDGPLEAIIALSIAATVFSSFFGPAIGALIPSLVADEDELGPANSAWATLDNLAFVIGPAVAGILIAVGGLTVAFVLNAASFGIVAIVLAGLRPTGSRAGKTGDGPGGAEGPVSAEPTVREALSAAGRPLVGLALIDLVGGFVFGGLGVLTVLLAVKTLGAGEEATGYLNAAIGVGGLAGAIASGVVVLRRHLGAPLLVGAMLFGAGVAVLGLTTTLMVALVAIGVASLGSLVVEVVSTTTFQRIVPDAVRGRLLGIMTTSSAAAYATGAFVVPVLSGVVGVTPIVVACGVAIAVASVVGILLIGPALGRAISPYESTLARLPNLAVFAGLPPNRLEAAMQRFTPRSVGAGTAVVSEGEPADRFYVVADGVFEVNQGPVAQARLIRTLGPGDWFGELGLLTERPRSATVRAATDGVVLALDGADFLELVGPGPGLRGRFLELYRGGATPRR